MEKGSCTICRSLNTLKQQRSDPESVFYICPVCGRYQITENALYNWSIDKNKMSSYLFYNGFKTKDNPTIDYRYYTTLEKEKCDEYVSEFKKGVNGHGHPVHLDKDIINSWYPRSFSEKINMILLKLDEMAEYVGQTIDVTMPELYGMMFVKRFSDDGKCELKKKEINDQVYYFLEYLNKKE